MLHNKADVIFREHQYSGALAMAQSSSHGPRVPDKTPPKAAVRQQLQRILASPQFKGSKRKARFLTFVIEQALSGHADRLTAYDIAVNAFEQDERFDPQTNPLIRIAARRVREALDRYYLTDGAGDPLRITIPVGHYVPGFEPMARVPSAITTVAPSPPAPAPEAITIAPSRPVMRWRYIAFGMALATIGFVGFEAARWYGGSADGLPARIGQRIAVEPVANATGDPEFDQIAARMGERLLIELSSSALLKVAGKDGGADLVLKETLERFDGGVRTQTVLISARTGKVLWAQSYPIVEAGDKGPADAAVTGDIVEQIKRITERR